MALTRRTGSGIFRSRRARRLEAEIAAAVAIDRKRQAATAPEGEVHRQIKSSEGRTWRRTVRIIATEWVADEEVPG